MYYENVELHGIEGIDEGPKNSVLLKRVPEVVREKLEEPARNKTLNPAGAEIRFVMNGERARITLSSFGDEGSARIRFRFIRGCVGSYCFTASFISTESQVMCDDRINRSYRKKHC